MKKEISKAELISAIAESVRSSGIKKSQVKEVVNSFCETIVNALAEGNEVRIRNFGKFFMKERAARIGRNPKTGKEIKIPPKLVPAFKAGGRLRRKTEKVKAKEK